MDLKTKRLADYKITQLFPINIIEENKKKRLSLSLNLFKICQGFPKNEIGNFKKFQKSQEKDPVSQLLYKKNYQKLTEDEKLSVNSLLTKRAETPTRTSPYIKFLIKSLLKTIQENVEFSSFEEEINQGWVFKINNEMYDITTNKEKILTKNCIFINSDDIFDEISMLKKDCIIHISKKINNFLFEESKLNETNDLINKVIENYKKIYSLNEKVISLSIEKREKKLINNSF